MQARTPLVPSSVHTSSPACPCFLPAYQERREARSPCRLSSGTASPQKNERKRAGATLLLHAATPPSLFNCPPWQQGCHTCPGAPASCVPLSVKPRPLLTRAPICRAPATPGPSVPAGLGRLGSPASGFLRMCSDDSGEQSRSTCQNRTIAATF